MITPVPASRLIVHPASRQRSPPLTTIPSCRAKSKTSPSNRTCETFSSVTILTISNIRLAKDGDNSKIDDNFTPDDLATLADALDDLRTLGEMDLRLNHPSAGGR